MDKIEEVKRIKALFDEGAISESEFNLLKKKVIEYEPHHEAVESSSVYGENNYKRRSSLKYGFYLLIIATAGLGVKFLITYKQSVSNEKRIQISDNIDVIAKKEKNGNAVYQDGKEVGKIITKKINTIYPHSGSGVNTLNIPQGKMWTPLYYEFRNGTPSSPFVRIYSAKRKSGWYESDSYKFEETKHFFESIKFAKQNFKPLSAKTNPAIVVYSGSQAICTIYFFEESINY